MPSTVVRTRSSAFETCNDSVVRRMLENWQIPFLRSHRIVPRVEQPVNRIARRCTAQPVVVDLNARAVLVVVEHGETVEIDQVADQFGARTAQCRATFQSSPQEMRDTLPFGCFYGMATLVDTQVAACDFLSFENGRYEYCLRTSDYLAFVDAIVGAFAESSDRTCVNPDNCTALQTGKTSRPTFIRRRARVFVERTPMKRLPADELRHESSNGDNRDAMEWFVATVVPGRTNR